MIEYIWMYLSQSSAWLLCLGIVVFLCLARFLITAVRTKRIAMIALVAIALGVQAMMLSSFVHHSFSRLTVSQQIAFAHQAGLSSTRAAKVIGVLHEAGLHGTGVPRRWIAEAALKAAPSGPVQPSEGQLQDEQLCELLHLIFAAASPDCATRDVPESSVSREGV